MSAGDNADKVDRANKIGPLTRITIGGPEQSPNFSGDADDYIFIRPVTFRGQIRGGTIKTIGLRESPVFYEVEEDYNPCNTNSFLRALDEVLESQGWFLGYISSSDNTLVLKHERIKGNLYSHNPSSKEPE